MRLANNLLDFDRYAPGFDRLNTLSPAYQELRELLAQYLPSFELDEHAKVCDLGAGTGTFTLDVALRYPNASFIHVDMSSEMNEMARGKYEAFQLHDFAIMESFVQACDFPADHFDLVIMVNALNSCPPQYQVLRNIHKWVKPGGHLFLIDFGREQDTWDWTRYLSETVYRSQGLLGLVRELWLNREAIRQNRLARQDQSNGHMWLHTTEEFGEIIRDVGFTVKHIQPCYRGYSDLVVATKATYSDRPNL